MNLFDFFLTEKGKYIKNVIVEYLIKTINVIIRKQLLNHTFLCDSFDDFFVSIK